MGCKKGCVTRTINVIFLIVLGQMAAFNALSANDGAYPTDSSDSTSNSVVDSKTLSKSKSKREEKKEKKRRKEKKKSKKSKNKKKHKEDRDLH